ncbi:hypothetical protein SAMN05216436_11950 [bacterium A37T11]|nr:hypothetical protein SAMN05216436_11950 [bacterium A37T11]
MASCHSPVTNEQAHRQDSLAQIHKTDTPAAKTDSSWLLVPGVSAGKTKLDEPGDSVFKRLGKADAGDAAMGKAVAFWYTDGDSTGNVLSIYTSRDMGNDETARVKRIRVTSPSFKTNTGLGAGSNKKAIEMGFVVKPQESYQKDGKKVTILDAPEGIAFEVDDTGKCLAVIIHPRTDSYGSYLPLRTGVN